METGYVFYFHFLKKKVGFIKKYSKLVEIQRCVEDTLFTSLPYIVTAGAIPPVSLPGLIEWFRVDADRAPSVVFPSVSRVSELLI